MIHLLTLFIGSLVYASNVEQTSIPIILSPGISTVIEFDRKPTQAVLGDPRRFAIERLENSLVLKTKVTDHSTNLFVYFKGQKPKLFLLQSSEELKPTQYKKIDIIAKKVTNKRKTKTYKRSQVIKAAFDNKKDHLNVEAVIIASTRSQLKPKWNQAYIWFNKKRVPVTSTWSERRIIQRNTSVRSLFTFLRPDLPKNLKNLKLYVPIEGWKGPLSLSLRGKN